MVDIATLTGAVKMALGETTAGLFSNDDHIVDELIKAGEQSFEPLWHLPIQDEHKEIIKGETGDISNTGKGRYGGASSAAAFLLRFVEKDTKWAHLDIAGPARATSARPPISSD